MNLNQVTLPATNLNASVQFYRQLGFVQIVDATDYVRFLCPSGESTLSLYLVEVDGANAQPVVYFESKRVDALCAELQARGITFTQLPKDEPWMWREARLVDPAGNALCLFWAGKNRTNPPWRALTPAEPETLKSKMLGVLEAFPFLSLPAALTLLRVSVAGFFLAHAVARIAGNTIERFAAFLEGKGLPFGVALVWMTTAYEVFGSVALALGRQQRLLSAGFFFILATGIILIHADNGWFVGEHGTGGVEYSAALMVSLAVISAAARDRRARV
jgi:putative oxidoreductase